MFNQPIYTEIVHLDFRNLQLKVACQVPEPNLLTRQSSSTQNISVMPFRNRGTVYSRRPGTGIPCELSGYPIQTSSFLQPRDVIPESGVANGTISVTYKDLAELLTISLEDQLQKWNSYSIDGNPFQCQEWFGQLRAVVESALSSTIAKLNHLKNLLTGKSNSAIADIAYSGGIFLDALKMLKKIRPNSCRCWSLFGKFIKTHQRKCTPLLVL